MNLAVSINQPNVANVLDGNALPTPEPVSQSIPVGAVSARLWNKGSNSLDYGLDVVPATALASGASVVMALSNNKVLQFQGVSLLVDILFN